MHSYFFVIITEYNNKRWFYWYGSYDRFYECLVFEYDFCSFVHSSHPLLFITSYRKLHLGLGSSPSNCRVKIPKLKAELRCWQYRLNPSDTALQNAYCSAHTDTNETKWEHYHLFTLFVHLCPLSTCSSIIWSSAIFASSRSRSFLLNISLPFPLKCPLKSSAHMQIVLVRNALPCDRSQSIDP